MFFSKTSLSVSLATSKGLKLNPLEKCLFSTWVSRGLGLWLVLPRKPIWPVLSSLFSGDFGFPKIWCSFIAILWFSRWIVLDARVFWSVFWLEVFLRRPFVLTWYLFPNLCSSKILLFFLQENWFVDESVLGSWALPNPNLLRLFCSKDEFWLILLFIFLRRFESDKLTVFIQFITIIEFLNLLEKIRDFYFRLAFNFFKEFGFLGEKFADVSYDSGQFSGCKSVKDSIRSDYQKVVLENIQ